MQGSLGVRPVCCTSSSLTVSSIPENRPASSDRSSDDPAAAVTRLDSFSIPELGLEVASNNANNNGSDITMNGLPGYGDQRNKKYKRSSHTQKRFFSGKPSNERLHARRAPPYKNEARTGVGDSGTAGYDPFGNMHTSAPWFAETRMLFHQGGHLNRPLDD